MIRIAKNRKPALEAKYCFARRAVGDAARRNFTPFEKRKTAQAANKALTIVAATVALPVTAFPIPMRIPLPQRATNNVIVISRKADLGVKP
jgi:hypothetical protein